MIFLYLMRDSRVDPSSNHNEAIKQAISDGHVEIVKALLKEKADFYATAKFRLR